MNGQSAAGASSARPRHVIFICPLAPDYPSGSAAFIDRMARRLVERGVRVSVLTTTALTPAELWRPPGKTAPVAPLQPAPYAVLRASLAYPPPVPYVFAVLRRLGHLLQRSRAPAALQRPLLRAFARAMPALKGLEAVLDSLPPAEVVHIVESSWDGLFVRGVTWARCKRRVVVVTPLMHLGSPAVRSHFQMAHQVDAYRSADAVIALSRDEADEYVRLGVSRERIHFLPMGVDAPLAEWVRPDHGAALAASLGRPACLVAFLGANTYDKGAQTLALAVGQLRRSGLDVAAVFAGPHGDTFTEYLRRYAGGELLREPQRIHVLGVVDEAAKHALLEACHMLALPSQVDALGIVFLEAWLHRKPVIGATAGGIPEIVRPEETGLLVPFGDVDALAAAIRRLADDERLREQLGERGQARVLAGFTWDKTNERLMKIYEAAMTAQGRSR